MNIRIPKTIRHPKAFKDSKPANFDGIFDWSFLIPAFKGTKIQPTDIDCVVERNMKVLFLETKQPNKEVPLGQCILLENLILIGKGSIRVVVVYGKTVESISGMELWVYKNGEVKKEATFCSWQHVLQTVSSWFVWANNSYRGN